jgi:hypothetical protein
VELVHAVRARKVGEFDADRLMLMLLRIAAEAREPPIVLAHLLRPDLHHGLRYGVRPAQGGEIGDRLVHRRRVQVALAGNARVAAFLALRRLFQQDDLRAKLVRGNRGGRACRSEADDDDVGFDIPIVWH